MCIRHDVQVQETSDEKRDTEMQEGTVHPACPSSIDLSLVARTVLDTLHFKFLLYVFRDTTLHGNRIHPTDIFI
jgi:hypothetical protein